MEKLMTEVEEWIEPIDDDELMGDQETIADLYRYARSLEKQVREQEEKLQVAVETVKKAKDALESFDNVKGGYKIPHSKHCMSERTEVQEDMEFYGNDAMSVCDCYLNDTLESIESCDDFLSRLQSPPIQ
jgi:HPt (histidine-containing phosphotransfer) domain-containing protein